MSFAFDFLDVLVHVKITQISFNVQLHLKSSSFAGDATGQFYYFFLILFLIKERSSVTILAPNLRECLLFPV